MNIDDGGPAFPEINYNRVGEMEEGVSAGGMSFRDYFASDQKMSLDDSGLHYPDGYTVWTNLTLEKKVKWLIDVKYMIADTMIKVRKSNE